MKFTLVSKKVCVVCEYTVIGCTGDRDCEGSVHVISELEFETETDCP